MSASGVWGISASDHFVQQSHADLVRIEAAIQKATVKHNLFLKELGLPTLP